MKDEHLSSREDGHLDRHLSYREDDHLDAHLLGHSGMRIKAYPVGWPFDELLLPREDEHLSSRGMKDEHLSSQGDDHLDVHLSSPGDEHLDVHLLGHRGNRTRALSCGW